MRIKLGTEKWSLPPSFLIFFGLLIACEITLLFGFFSTPIVGDVTVNLASIKQAKYLGDWPNSVIESWDLRGFLNKNLMFILHNISEIGSPSTISAKEFLVKVAYFSLVILVIVISAIVLKEQFSNRTDVSFIVLLMGITVFSVSNSFVALQAELSAAVVGILITALASSSNQKKLILAGLLCCISIGFKGVTVLIGISAVFAGFALNHSDLISRLRKVGGSFAISLSSYLLGVVFLIPSELIDLRNATSLQSNFSYSVLGRLKISLGSVVFQWPHVPIIAVGLFFYFLVAIKHLKSKSSNFTSAKNYSLLLLTLSLFVAFFSILVQSKGFGYHLASMIPFSFAAILVYFKENGGLGGISSRMNYMIFALVLIVTSPTQSGIWDQLLNNYASQITSDNRSFKMNYDSRNQALMNLGKSIDKTCTGEILFLDFGTNYAVDNKSWLRFVVPMPIQRNLNSLRGTTLQREAVENALRFKGECVTLEPSRMNSVLQPWAAPLYDYINRNFLTVRVETYQLYGEDKTTLLLRRKI